MCKPQTWHPTILIAVFLMGGAALVQIWWLSP